jgi:uncharacterized protein involved in tolerance to divalent cations
MYSKIIFKIATFIIERIILEKKIVSCVDWIHLTHVRYQWRALVNMVMNLLVL